MGAIATFFGTVRIQNAGKDVVAVEYHAYPAMAEKMLEEIGREMERGFGPLRVALVHRIGRLGVGEISVGIAAAAPHRHQALGAVAYAIERLKQRVPVWEREFYSDGSAWLEPAPAPPAGEYG
jgi:molybdopterin synthase catalytic subunit